MWLIRPDPNVEMDWVIADISLERLQLEHPRAPTCTGIGQYASIEVQIVFEWTVRIESDDYLSKVCLDSLKVVVCFLKFLPVSQNTYSISGILSLM
jgi:hypothetical protein